MAGRRTARRDDAPLRTHRGCGRVAMDRGGRRASDTAELQRAALVARARLRGGVRNYRGGWIDTERWPPGELRGCAAAGGAGDLRARSLGRMPHARAASVP